MKQWSVMVPFAGHILVIVEAETEELAIEKAINDATLDQVEDWEALEQFNRGNVCYCPRPWEAEATDESDEDD